MTNFEKKQKIIESQRAFFRSGVTLSVGYRITALKKLYRAIERYEDRILEALNRDLGKSSMEGYMCEVGIAKSEISHMLIHICLYAEERRVPTPIANLPGKTWVRPVPYGNVLIISPWNYPFLLSIEPLVDAIAAGNTVVLKPSAYSAATTQVVKDMIEEIFPKEYVAVMTGGRFENQFLFSEKWDYIFFTGSQTVGKEVLRRAAEHLTPVTLELGGKSPCIVDETANIKAAAKRIVFAKFLNCGQTCVAPDYVLCAKSVRNEILTCMKKEVVKQFGENAFLNPSYGKIINRKHYRRLLGLIDENKIVTGGKRLDETLQIEPTILKNVTWEDAVMREEIFGPILPVLTYDSLEEVIDTVESYKRPLALYMFSRSRSNIKMITEQCRYGGGCINDCIMHLVGSNAPFGGVGESGMGAYHGKYGFDTFSHFKTIVDRKWYPTLPIRYQPYSEIGEKLARLFLL